MARLADHYGLAFLGLTLLLAAGAWAFTGDPMRALAVLVVATPCPLILAVPVALVSGLSRAAGNGVLIKGGGALETLAKIRELVIDKTGTLTHGSAQLTSTRTFDPFDEAEALRLAASLDQASGHPIARALVEEARRPASWCKQPAKVTELPGVGVSGWVEGRHILVGGPFLMRMHDVHFPPADGARRVATAATATVLVASEGAPAAVLELVDPLRKEGGGTLAALRECGIARIVLATGAPSPRRSLQA